MTIVASLATAIILIVTSWVVTYDIDVSRWLAVEVDKETEEVAVDVIDDEIIYEPDNIYARNSGSNPKDDYYSEVHDQITKHVFPSLGFLFSVPTDRSETYRKPEIRLMDGACGLPAPYVAEECSETWYALSTTTSLNTSPPLWVFFYGEKIWFTLGGLWHQEAVLLLEDTDKKHKIIEGLCPENAGFKDEYNGQGCRLYVNSQGIQFAIIYTIGGISPVSAYWRYDNDYSIKSWYTYFRIPHTRGYVSILWNEGTDEANIIEWANSVRLIDKDGNNTEL